MDDANKAAGMARKHRLNETAKLIQDQAARIEALEARIAKADALAAAQQFFNFCAVEILTYGASVARLQNLENAWVKLKTQAEIAAYREGSDT